MPTLSDTNLVAFKPESGRQLPDVVGLTASRDCVWSDKAYLSDIIIIKIIGLRARVDIGVLSR